MIQTSNNFDHIKLCLKKKRKVGEQKEKASYACFQQALENGVTFSITKGPKKRNTKVLSRTQLQRIFCHLSVRKAISNTDMQRLIEVEVEMDLKKKVHLNLNSTPRTEKVQNLIFSRLKITFQDPIIRDKYIREETIRNSRSQVKKSRSQEVKKSRSQEVKYRRCNVCNVMCDIIVTMYDNSIRRHLLRVHPVLCKLSKYDLENICPVVKIEL